MDINITDPRGGIVTLRETTWTKHILTRHPIMQQLRNELELTLTNPDFIYQSRADRDAHLYYKRFTHQQWGAYFLMAVIDTHTHIVKTAFPVYNLNKGKKRLWP